MSPEPQTETSIERPRVCGMLLHAYYVRDPRVQRAAHALRDAGWTVKVICLNEGDEVESEVIDGVQVIRCPMSRSSKRTRFRYIIEYGGFMLRSFFRLWREDRREKHDVVMVHNMPNALVFSTLAVRLRGCPVILDMHDAAPEVFASMFGVKSRVFKKVLLLEETLAMKFASGLITVNRGVEKVLQRRQPWAKFLLVHNSPSGKLLAQNEVTRLQNGGEFRIVFHGHLHERNGLQRLVRALPTLLSGGMRVTLDAHGDGPYRQALIALTEELELRDVVRFHGAFKPSELPAVLAGKHLGVALHFAEDFGDLLLPVKILEYTEAGVPVITSRLKTVEDYFPDDCVGYFDTDEELVERIREVYDDYDAALEGAVRARSVAASISWERDSTKLVDFVETLCGTR